MTQIVPSIPTGGITSTLSPWRNHILVCTDSYRAVLYSDGTSLKIATAPTGQAGETWTASAALLAQSAITPLVDAVFLQGKLYLLVVTSTSMGGSVNGATLYAIPYSGLGVFTVAGMTSRVIAGAGAYAAPPLSARLLADPNGTCLDASHTAGQTGLLHALVDLGGTWWLHALDPHNSTTPVAVLHSQSMPSGVVGPSGATNMILRATDDLYALTPGSAAWVAREMIFSSVTTAIPAGNGPTYFTWSLPARGPATLLTAGQYYTLNSTVSWLPVTATPTGAGAIVYTAPSGGASFAAGTWTVQVAWTTDTRLEYALRARVYHQTAAGTNTLIGSLPLGFEGSTNNSCTGSLPAVTLPAGDKLYVEIDLLCNADLGLADTITSTGSGGSVLTPTSTVGGATLIVDSYAVGAAEAPALFVSPYGAALCLGDTTANPAIDAFVYRSDLQKIQLMHRYGTGGYASPLSIGGTNLVAGGVAASQNLTTGEEDVFALATFGGVAHIGRMSRETDTGTWSTFAQEDTASAAVSGQFGAVGAGSLGKIGPAIIYRTGTALDYEDANFAASETPPLAPTGLILVESAPGAGDVAGASSPFNTTDLRPMFRFTYLHNNPSDPLGAYLPEVTHGTGPTIDWNPGALGIGAGGPLSGASFTFQYPVTGSGVAALVPYTTYAVTVKTQDVMSGQTGPASAPTTFTVVTAPTVSLDIPSDITSFTPVAILGFWHDQAFGWASYQLRFLDAAGRVLVDTGQQGFANDQQSSTLAASAAAGANQIVTHHDLAADHLISLGDLGSSTQEYQTVTTSVPVGDGTFTVTLAGRLSFPQTSGTRVYACYQVPGLDLWPGLANDTAYSAEAICWVDPPTSIGGAAWEGITTVAVTTDFPKPPQPHDLSVSDVAGTQPLAGGWDLVRWQLDAATGSQPAAATVKLYYRETDAGGPWIPALPAPRPALIGEDALRLLSIPNRIPQDIAIASLSAQGVESDRVLWPAATLVFRLGLWLTDLSDTRVMVELGRMPRASGGAIPLKWAFAKKVDKAQVFNRRGLVMTRGSTYARQTPTATEFTLDAGYARPQLAQLHAWCDSEQELLIREPGGAVFVAVLTDVQEGFGARVDYRTVLITLDGSETAPYDPTCVYLDGSGD